MIERTKSFVKSVFPSRAVFYRRLRAMWLGRHLANPSLQETFCNIYQNNSWGDSESVSGRGSTLSRTEVIRQTLPTLLATVDAKSLLDAPCGDFNWMRHVDLGQTKYIGADVVPELIAANRRAYEAQSRTFIALDITRDSLPVVDVILCRDCFSHLSYRDVHAAIANFKSSNSRYLLATTHATVSQNTEIRSGDWRSVNLQLPPFNFPPPSQFITEDAELGKQLGLWALSTL